VNQPVATHYIIFLLALGLGPFLIVYGYKWLVLPLRIKRKQTLLLTPQMQPTRVEELTPETRQFLGAMIRAFAAEGFDVGTNVLLPNLIPSSQAVQVLLVNRATGDEAIVYGTFVRHTRTLVFGISSKFLAGQSVDTYSIPSVGVLPRNPAADGLVVPWVKEVATLAELHRRRLRKLGREKDARKPVPVEGALDCLRQHHADACEWMVRCGYWYADKEGRVLRYTLKGAYLSAWKVLEPIKSMRLRRRDRIARRAWAELEMDRWQPPVTATADAAQVVGSPGAAHESPPQDVTYEVALRDGELRVDRRGNAIIVRLGRPSRSEVLAGERVRLLFMTVIAVGLGRFAWNMWLMYRIFGTLTWRIMRTPKVFRIWLVVGTVYLLWDLGWLGWKVSRKPLPMSVTATPAGLTYQHAPMRPHSGRIARDQIDGMFIGLRRLGIFRRTYALLLVCYDGRRLLLLSAPKKQALEDAVAAIKRGLGMAVEKPVESK